MTMLDARAIGRAVLALALLVGVGCSFKDKGINTSTSVEFDADGTGLGGTSGGGMGGGVVRLDGSAGGKDGPSGTDGPPPAQTDAELAVDLGVAPPDAPGLGLGSTCTTDGVCDSGFCADGVCCDKRCGEPCLSCGGGNGAKAGTCAPDPADTVCGAASCSGATLTPAPRCDGNGGCMTRPGAACPGSLTCASEAACRTKCAANSDCAGGMVCDVAAGTCRPPGKPNGQACTAGPECTSGNCVDKVCCDGGCTGLCRSCLAAQTGKPDGTCANLLAGQKDTRCERQEPGTCGRDGTCDGSGACRRYPNGTRCGTGCCRDTSGPGGGVHVCAFECFGGTCDHNRPAIIDRCGGAQCCCPTGAPGGGPACTGALGCPLGTCQ
jgi:hypothetical protein